MSYILDALRKSEQLRRRGAVPTLAALPMAMAQPERRGLLRHGALGLIPIVILSVAVGWFASLRTESGGASAVTAPVAAAIPVQRSVPAIAAVEVPRPMVKATPERILRPMATAIAPAVAVRRRPPAPVAATSLAAARGADAGSPDSPNSPVVVKDIMSISELPVAIRQGLPPMPVAVHAYSSKPGDRLVSINGRLLHEGDELAAGLRLEQITPEGMVFGYRGYRFRRPAQ
jgi:general secretion pathway protein B